MNKYQVWETILFQRGKEYLEEKINYYQELIKIEEVEKTKELELPGSELRDLSFYEVQIADYQETIDIIKFVLKNYSSKRPLYNQRIRFARNLGKSYPKMTKSAITSKVNQSTNPGSRRVKPAANPSNSVKKQDYYSKSQKKRKVRKFRIKYTRMIWVFSLLLFILLLIILFIIHGIHLFTESTQEAINILSGFLGTGIIFIILDIFRNKKRTIKTGNQYYSLLAKKFSCIPDKLSLYGYVQGYHIKMFSSIENHKLTTKVIVISNTKDMPMAWISTNEKKNISLKKIYSGVFNFDAKFKIYCDDQKFINNITTDNFVNLLISHANTNKSFEFVIFENRLHYTDYSRNMNSIDDLIFFERIIKLFVNLAEIIDRLKLRKTMRI